MPSGRIPKKFAHETFEQLCLIHCTADEIRRVLKIDYKTLKRAVKRHYGHDFAEICEDLKANGKVSLRRVIWKEALEKKNVVLIKLLAANHLGLTEKQDQRVNVNAMVSADSNAKLTATFRVLESKDDKEYFDRPEED